MDNTEISQEDLRDAIGRIMHPAIDKSLVELGMIRDIEFTGGKGRVTLVLPFPGVPILDALKRSIVNSVSGLGIEVEITEVQMTQAEVQNFLAMEKEAWKGL